MPKRKRSSTRCLRKKQKTSVLEKENDSSMPNRKRRHDAKSCLPVNDNNTNNTSTIRAAIGSKAKLFRLWDFIQRYAPALDYNERWNELATRSSCNEHRRLSETWISPSDSLTPMNKNNNNSIKKAAMSRQSLSSLIDDVVWSLVQRRKNNQHCYSNKSRQKNDVNILAQGYVASSEKMPEVQLSNMRPGVQCTYLNNNVSFCKTSDFFRVLHSLLGDDILRMILLHTRMFLPVEKKNNNDSVAVPSSSSQGNFMMICGPPLKSKDNWKSYKSRKKRHLKRPASTTMQSDKNKRRRLIANTSATRKPAQQSTLKPNATIRRQSLFYSNAFVPKAGLPQGHLLNGQAVNAEKLLGAMVDLHKDNGKRRRKPWKRLRSLGISVCEGIIKRHTKCDYHRLLERYCPLPEYVQQQLSLPKKNQDNGLSIPELGAAYTPTEQVVSFLSSTLSKVFPQDFWGSSYNLDRVLHTVATFVNLRRREKLPNKTLMKNLRVTDVGWLQGNCGGQCKNSRTNHEATTRLLLQVMRWLFSDYIIPLLRSNFYATETEFSDKKVLFYRKPVWSLFRSLSMKKLCKEQYVEIKQGEAMLRLQKQSMGCSLLRLLPKFTGVRPIATLCKREPVTKLFLGNAKSVQSATNVLKNAQSKEECTEIVESSSPSAARQEFQSNSSYQSTNLILRDAYAVLEYECYKKPETTGVGIRGLHEFYSRYRCFIDALKNKGRASGKRLYFASVDIHHCYDNMNQDHLLGIIERNLLEDDYLIQRYTLLHQLTTMKKVILKKKRKVGPPETFEPLYKLAKDLTCHQTIFVDGVSCQLTKKDQMLELLQEHLKGNLLVAKGRFGNRYLLQNKGIPQGSILSSLLCNTYYGDAEHRLLDVPTLVPDTSLINSRANDDIHHLVRLVDDFLLVTTNAQMAIKFLRTMSKGNASLGVKINKEKTRVNMDVTIDNGDGTVQELKDITMTEGKPSFSWCGMLFNTQTGEVRVDYSRFEKGRVGNSLTVARNGVEGQRFESQLKMFVKPRCLPILFDPAINSIGVRMKNFYEMMVFCAVKTLRYLQSSDMMSTINANFKFLVRCIDNAILYANALIRYRLEKECEQPSIASQDQSDFASSSALHLGWHAFQVTFSHLEEFDKLSHVIASKANKARSKSNLQDKVLSSFEGKFLVERLLMC